MLPDLRLATSALPSSCVVYGAGSFGRMLLSDLREAGVDVVALVDRRADELGTEVMFPEASREFAELPCFVGVCNPDVDPNEIAGSARALGYERVWSPAEAYAALGRAGLRRNHYWLTSDVGIYERRSGEIERAHDLLADELSQASFERLLGYRTRGDLDLLPEREPQQYYPRDLSFVDGSVSLVDGGAFDGDTVRAYVGAGIDLASVVAFEPDAVNFESLVLELAGHPNIEAIALPMALGRKTELVRFQAEGASSSAVDASGEVVVQCVALDDVLHRCSPTHVKLDLEGFEMDALAGMRGLLRSTRPRLAVSLYHVPDHLWTILLQLASLDLGYRFHIRCHAWQCFETILYAIPEL
jgi:FkbM family methyltransferase